MTIYVIGAILAIFVIANIRQVNEYERGVLFLTGKYQKIVGSGWKFIIPIFQSVRIIDMRTRTVDLKDQEAMTSENVSVRIGAVVFFKVVDASKCVLEVENFQWAISQLSETTMRSVIGQVSLNELLSNRQHVADKIEGIIEPHAVGWGLKIVGVELKDIVLPEDMKRIMAKQAEAEREKNAAITKAEGELIASENLAKAASKMAQAPGALHLRTLSTISDLSSDQSNTIIFTLPLEVLRAFEGRAANGVGGIVDAISKKLSDSSKKG